MKETILFQIKAQLTIFFISAIAFYTPVHKFLMASFILYSINILIAIIHDKKEGNNPNIKKFFISLKEYGIYLGSLLIVYLICYLINEEDFGLFVSKYMTIYLIYFFSQNSIKNLKLLSPESKFIEVLDFFVNGKFLTDKVPIIEDIKNWLNKKQ